MKYPLFRGRVTPGLPRRGEDGCLVCGNTLVNGLVYLSAGSVFDVDPDDPKDKPQLEAFFHIGYHSPASDVSGCADIAVVDHLVGGQFDLSFCSTACLKHFFSDLVADLEMELVEEKGARQVDSVDLFE